jgi:hypothetical protein
MFYNTSYKENAMFKYHEFLMPKKKIENFLNEVSVMVGKFSISFDWACMENYSIGDNVILHSWFMDETPNKNYEATFRSRDHMFAIVIEKSFGSIERRMVLCIPEKCCENSEAYDHFIQLFDYEMIKP